MELVQAGKLKRQRASHRSIFRQAVTKHQPEVRAAHPGTLVFSQMTCQLMPHCLTVFKRIYLAYRPLMTSERWELSLNLETLSVRLSVSNDHRLSATCSKLCDVAGSMYFGYHNCFLQIIQANITIIPQIGHDRFLLRYLYLIHYSESE